MRSLRWLLLAAIVLIAAAVFGIYRAQRVAERRHRPRVPPSVGLDTKATAVDYEWGQSSNGKPAVRIRATSFKQSSAGDKAELQGIELSIFQKDGQHHDLVKSAAAQFDPAEGKMFSSGEAEITLDVPNEGQPAHQLTSIKTSGVTFESKTGRAITDKPVSFTFENGNGTCLGASYDPQIHELHLDHDVVLNLRGKGPKSKPMKVEAGVLVYKEAEAIILLGPWSRLTRDQTVINGASSTIKIKDGVLDWIDALRAAGTDKQPNRQLEYGAELVHVQYDESGEMEKLIGTGNARLVSHGAGSETTMTGNAVNLFFTDNNGDSVLTSATASGNGSIESKPLPDPKGNTPDTKILRSETIDLFMRPGGKDLEHVQTHAPGTLEFLPNQAARHRRILKGDRMTVAYGAQNEIQSFHATTATTETYPSEEEKKKKKPNLAIAYTSSKTLDAVFDGKGQLTQMKQAENFHYSAADRKAQADIATLDNERNLMDLDANARIGDDTGSTTADHIQLQQNTGDFDARGHVSTTRLPEQKKSASSMLDEDEPTQGTAERVTSANRNRLIHYIGNAVLWQSSNRIQADRVDIDREKKNLTADGNVITQFQDSENDDDEESSGQKPAEVQPVFTIVKAQHLVYTDEDRLAAYTGDVSFWRPTITVKSAALKAFLNEKDSDEDSRIHHAFGDGKVEIVQISPDRRRVGTGEHAEYYTSEGKIILTGGDPQLNDTKRGNTKGEKLTYFTDDDRLLVNGAPQRPVQSHLRHKKS